MVSYASAYPWVKVVVSQKVVAALIDLTRCNARLNPVISQTLFAMGPGAFPLV